MSCLSQQNTLSLRRTASPSARNVLLPLLLIVKALQSLAGLSLTSLLAGLSVVHCPPPSVTLTNWIPLTLPLLETTLHPIHCGLQSVVRWLVDVCRVRLLLSACHPVAIHHHSLTIEEIVEAADLIIELAEVDL
jgi:hypothetical protein